MKNLNIACVIGTRPEALKMIPVIEELQKNPNFCVKIIFTGQHRSLLEQILTHTKIRPHINFDVMQENQSLNYLTANLLTQFENYLNKEAVDLLIAQGDTTTTFVSALSAFYKKIPFAHIEAGLRTSCINNPFPEEFNRRAASMMSTLHFCPTLQAAQNLKEEGITKHVYTTGNTIIDMLYKNVTPDTSFIDHKKSILVTCHRRENFGKPLASICHAIKEIALKHSTFNIIFPVHPNPNVRSVVYKTLSNIKNINLCEPLDYVDLVNTMNHSYLVLTDSGGLQEEAPALKKPVLILRNETERPEAVEIGAARLVGCDIKTIVDSVRELIDDAALYQKMSEAGSPYGDGKASERIARVIKNFFDNSQSTQEFIENGVKNLDYA